MINFLKRNIARFWVKEKIKKVNHGPVVTLNEFEPAASVKKCQKWLTCQKI